MDQEPFYVDFDSYLKIGGLQFAVTVKIWSYEPTTEYAPASIDFSVESLAGRLYEDYGDDQHRRIEAEAWEILWDCGCR